MLRNQVLAVAAFFAFGANADFAQNPTTLRPPTPATQTPLTQTSAQFVAQDGLTVERLVGTAMDRRTDLLGARQRLAIAQGRLIQAGLRPNPVLSTEYGSTRFLGGEAESDLSAGLSQTFELGGKRSKRVAVAELELQQVRAEVAALERQVAVGIRTAYTRAVSSARQLDIIERLLAADADLIRVTEARLNQGDVAPLDLNLVRVESDRLRIQQIEARSTLETALLEIRTLVGLNIAEPLRLAPLTERPPRLDMGLNELTEIALRERADLQAARIGERLGSARINLARSQAVPNVAASVNYSRSKSILEFPARLGGGSFPNLDNSLIFGVAVEIPVFNRNQGAIASALSEQTQATRTREFLETTIKRDVAVAYRGYRASAEKLVLYATQILPRSEANLQTVRSAYGAGEFSVFDTVNEQRRLTESVTGYNQSLQEYYKALTDLENALGTQIPPAAFSSEPVSVLPDKQIVPQQVDKEKLLKSLAEKSDGNDFLPPNKVKQQERK